MNKLNKSSFTIEILEFIIANHIANNQEEWAKLPNNNYDKNIPLSTVQSLSRKSLPPELTFNTSIEGLQFIRDTQQKELLAYDVPILKMSGEKHTKEELIENCQTLNGWNRRDGLGIVKFSIDKSLKGLNFISQEFNNFQIQINE